MKWSVYIDVQDKRNPAGEPLKHVFQRTGAYPQNCLHRIHRTVALFLPLVKFREKQNFKTPGMCNSPDFVITRRNANHSLWPSSKVRKKVKEYAQLFMVPHLGTKFPLKRQPSIKAD